MFRIPYESNAGRFQFTCDRCGVPRDSSEMHEEWNGFIVCNTCYDPKHPLLDEGQYQYAETAYIEDARPSPYQTQNTCTLLGASGIVGQGQVGCFIVGNELPPEMLELFISLSQE